VPAQMICLLHPWQDPVPFRRVWCLFELYIAITLGAKVIMHFPAEDAAGFYSKLRKDEADVETAALVPTIDAKQAQATMEGDRVRIFQEIADSIGMDEFNRQLQEYLEGAMRAAAMEALLLRGGLESVGAGGTKATMGVLRAELEQVKQLLAKGQEETKQEVKDASKETTEEVTKTKQELKRAQGETKQEVQETRQELTGLAAVLEETKKEMQLTASNTDARISALDRKIDKILALMSSAGGQQEEEEVASGNLFVRRTKVASLDDKK
jgi:hypothetical protein